MPMSAVLTLTRVVTLGTVERQSFFTCPAGGSVFPGKGGTKIEHMFGVAREWVARAPSSSGCTKTRVKMGESLVILTIDKWVRKWYNMYVR
jgi:hypothetical protein